MSDLPAAFLLALSFMTARAVVSGLLESVTMALVLCQRNSYLQKHTAKVVSCAPSSIAGSWDVVLDDTILFPTGGGQPCDFGTIGRANVTDVSRVPGAVIHRTSESVEVGAEVEINVDWNRRFDHMQQHSAQHLISSIAATQFAAPTMSWGLMTKESAIDFDNTAFDLDAMMQLEKVVNTRIREARPVKVLELKPEELQSIPELRSRGLPEGLDVARVINIEGIDHNPCCGTHVSNTAELQLVKFTGLQKKKGGVRVTFLAGERALAALNEYVVREQAMNKLLDCGGDQHVEAVGRLQAAQKALLAESKVMQKELAEAIGKSLAHSEKPFALYHREGGKPDFLQAVAKATHSQRDQLLLFLSCGAEKGEGQFLLTGPEALVSKAAPKVLTALNAKGGGRSTAFQGKMVEFCNKVGAVESVLAEVTGVAAAAPQ